MTISTRGRYALRVLVDLAQRQDQSFLPLREVAARQGISTKYLERILPVLVRSGCIEAQHGKGGGYRLGVDPHTCTVGQVLRLTEGALTPVACLEAEAQTCLREAVCPTVQMWREFERLTNAYFDAITIGDLAEQGGIRDDDQ